MLAKLTEQYNMTIGFSKLVHVLLLGTSIICGSMPMPFAKQVALTGQNGDGFSKASGNCND